MKPNGEEDMMRLRRAGVAFACALAFAATVVGVATADPSNGSDPLTYSFTDCSDGSSFEAIKQRSEGAALFLTDGSGIFVAMAAVSDRDQIAPDGTFIEEGTVFFETPGSRAGTSVRRSPAPTSRRSRKPGRASPDTSRGRRRVRGNDKLQRSTPRLGASSA